MLSESTITDTTGATQVVLLDAAEKSTITTGDKADKVYLTEDASAEGAVDSFKQSTVSTGAGNDTIVLDGDTNHDQFAGSTITAGAGNDSVMINDGADVTFKVQISPISIWVLATTL